jgi:hypothetical protein
LKVFGIGFHKTGTTTLETACRQLGLKTAPVRTDLVKSLSRNDLMPTLKVARNYEVFQDNPWPMLYKQMLSHFPNARFILTLRDEERWMKSILNSFGGKSTPMREWIYGKGLGDPKKNPDIFLHKYRRHNEDVRDFFQDKPDKLLEVNWEQGDGWDPLCAFLDKPEPTVDFPHANKGNYTPKSKGLFPFTKKKS